MKYLGSILAAAIVLALLPAPATAQCDCTNASLMGTNVDTRAGAGPVLTRQVTSATELHGQGPALFGAAAGGEPIVDIDFHSGNQIRIYFLVQAGKVPMTHNNTSFTFSNLSPPAPAGCTAPIITDAVVTTNKANAQAIVAGRTYTDHSVTIPFAGPTNIQWLQGERIDVTLTFACAAQTPPGPGSCCPPWSATQLRSMLFYQGTGAIGAPYTLRFTPTAALNNQMNTYVTYLKSLGVGFTGLTVRFELFNAGTGASAAPGGTPVTYLLTWTGSGNPTGIPTVNFFPPGATSADRWYRVRTTIMLNGGPSGYLPATCLESFVDVRLQVI